MGVPKALLAHQGLLGDDARSSPAPREAMLRNKPLRFLCTVRLCLSPSPQTHNTRRFAPRPTVGTHS